MEIRSQGTAKEAGWKRDSLPVRSGNPDVEKTARHQRWDITALPAELAEKILSYQSVRDVSVCRLVSRRWKSFIDDFHLQARSFYRRCYPDVPFTCRQEIGDRDYRATCQWLQHLAGGTRVGSRSLEQLDLLKTKADPYFCQELCWAISVGFAQAKFDQPTPIYTTKHPRPVRDFDLSASGNHIVSIAYQSLQYLDLSTCRATISIHSKVGGQWQQQTRIVEPGYVRSFAFSQDEQDCVVVVYGSGAVIDSYRVLIWHSSNGDWQHQVHRTYTGDDYVNTTSLTPCGHYLAIASSSLELYHRTDEKWQRQDVLLPQIEFTEEVVFSADTHHFLVTCSDKTFRLFHRVGGQWLAQGIVGWSSLGRRPVFSPDGSYFAVVHRGVVTVWAYEQESWEPQRRIKGSGVVRALNFPSEGHLIISYWDVNPELWVLANGEQDRVLKFPCCASTNISTSPDNRHFAWYEHNSVSIWGLVGGWLRKQGKIEHSDAVRGISFSPDGQLLATASADKTAKVIRRIGALWREQQSIVHSSGVLGVRFSPAGDYLLTTDYNGSVNLWTLASLGSDPALPSPPTT